MPLEEHLERDAVLFLWCIEPMRFEAGRVVEAWGFQHKSAIIWDKIGHNFGNYVSVRHEHLLICTRGSCTPDRPTPMPDSVMTIPRSDVHSEKPPAFRALIERLYNGPYVELFGRREVEGWTVYGNQWLAAPAIETSAVPV
jgi:N6-adenosine-specific RNA methylase IME4